MLRRAVARALEQGVFDGVSARLLGRGWAACSNPVRPVRLPPGARVVGVGGATLGGSGKTPVVLALARALAAKHRVAVVASGYRARTRSTRQVEPSDDAEHVGDEAAWLARALADVSVRVFVGPSRELALSCAARDAQVVIVDGLLQTSPERLACSFLVLDDAAPWGARRCPPAGDLRASPDLLLAACDSVLLGPGGEPMHHVTSSKDVSRVLWFRARVRGARTPSGRFVSLSELARTRLGLVLAIARPERVLTELAGHGINPTRVELHADHARMPAGSVRGLDVWLTTPKCATKLQAERAGAPVWVLERRLELPTRALALAAGDEATSATAQARNAVAASARGATLPG